MYICIAMLPGVAFAQSEPDSGHPIPYWIALENWAVLAIVVIPIITGLIVGITIRWRFLRNDFYGYVYGIPKWSFDASWASNLTAIAGVVNIGGVINLFSAVHRPQLLQPQQYTLYTLLLAGMILFAAATLTLTSSPHPAERREKRLWQPRREDSPEERQVAALEYLARIAAPRDPPGAKTRVWIYVMSQGLIVAAVSGQLTIFVLLLSELMMLGWLSALMFGIGSVFIAALMMLLLVTSIQTTVKAIQDSAQTPEASATPRKMSRTLPYA